MLESRRPEARAWEGWTEEATRCRTDVAGAGPVTRWVEVLDVDGPSVTFRWTFLLGADGSTLTSTTTLRFRTAEEIEDDLQRAGFTVVDLRDAPDRPGLELVYVACRR